MSLSSLLPRPLSRRSILFALLALPLAYAKVQKGPHGGPRDGDEMIYDGHPRASAMVGWISIACWLWLCYVQQSGEGLSLIFLCIWLAGDLTNMLGALWQGLIPTMIILAVYYTICDIILIFQVFYYRRKRALYPSLYSTALPTSTTANGTTSHLSIPSESDPLLSSFSASVDVSQPDAKQKRFRRDLMEYSGGVVGVVLVALVAWRLSRGAKAGRKLEVWDTKAQVVGWISAFLYLGSRLPQIAKNAETKCQGLSLAMFGWSIMGNLTYVSSILLTSLSPQHVLINAAWLIGSGGTIFLDAIVLGQFWYYSSARKEAGKIFLSGDDDLLDDAEEA